MSRKDKARKKSNSSHPSHAKAEGRLRRAAKQLWGIVASKWFLALFYLIFLYSAGSHIRDVIRYWNVESWPSVNAEIIGSGGYQTSFTRQSRYYGVSSTSIDTEYVAFVYAVDGKTYLSTKSTPDKQGPRFFPPNIEDFPPSRGPKRKVTAYYKPSAPDIAVLHRAKYEGSTMLLIAGFSGFLVFGHIMFAFVLPYFGKI